MTSGPTDRSHGIPVGTAYVLERELGRGGMATVFLAHDTKHDRRVAVKVLHAELAAVVGTERFLHEIRVTATLQHPHILGLIDSGVFGDDAGDLRNRPYYVMPFVEGESLRQRLDRDGQLPVADAVRLAVQVASALDYAHRHGVIHRDIKPENILLHDGSALVADFGIALAVQQAGGQRLTQTGLSLGTPQYMSPEQAMGERTVTARTDVYALGAVTYEMLVGEPPFTGPTVQAIVARLIAEPPRPIASQRRSVPAHVEAVVLHALEKLPADRFATPAEFAAALEDRSVSSTIGVRREGSRQSHLWSAIPWALTALAVGLLTFNLMRPGPALAPPPMQRFSIVLPTNGAWEDDPNLSFALSPDASLLAYNGLDSASQRRLYIRAMDRDTPTPVPGSETAHFPGFSPDGRWLGFVLNSRLMRARTTGGTPEPVCDLGGLSHWSWLGPDDAVFIDGAGLKQCSTTGDVEIVLASDTTESFQFPHALPDGRHVLFGRRRGSESRLAAIDLATRVVTSLDILGSDPRYVKGGYLVYATGDGSIRAVRFDAKALKVTGEPMVVDTTVHTDGQGRAFMAVSRGGTIVAPLASSFKRALTLVDRAGRAVPVYSRPGEFSAPRFSPDGRRIAVAAGPGIWQLDRAQGTLTRVSFDAGSAERPAWSPDGKRIAYVRRVGPRNDIRIIDADGGRPPQTLLSTLGMEPWHVLFTPDGGSIVVRTVGRTGGRDILRVMLDSGRQTTPLLATTAEEVSPALSPDGRWLAYASNESGRYEVYVRSFPSMANRTQISLEGGSDPTWSPRGNEVFYRTGMTLMAAEVRLASSADVVRRAPLFPLADYDDEATYQNYDVAPDGQHFVMVRVSSDRSRPLSVTLNRFDNLEPSVSARRSQ